MLSLGLAREGLVCLRENLRTQGLSLRFQERVRQGNFRYARGVVLKVSGRCVHLGWQIASETKKAKCLVQAPGRTLEAVSWLKIYSKKRPSQLQCSRANLARVPSKVPVWVCDLYFYNCEQGRVSAREFFLILFRALKTMPQATDSSKIWTTSKMEKNTIYKPCIPEKTTVKSLKKSK